MQPGQHQVAEFVSCAGLSKTKLLRCRLRLCDRHRLSGCMNYVGDRPEPPATEQCRETRWRQKKCWSGRSGEVVAGGSVAA